MLSAPNDIHGGGASPVARRSAALLLTCAALFFVSLSGCGNRLAGVSGTVTLDGEPIRGAEDVRATVYFNPVDPGGASAVGLVDESGRYELTTGSEEGVTPGKYHVTFTATRLVAPQGEGETPSGKRISPARYASPGTSGLKFTVEPGSNTYDLALESSPP